MTLMGNITVVALILMPLGHMGFPPSLVNTISVTLVIVGPGYNSSAFYIDDPLWDGEGCCSTSSCCEFNSPLWFCKSLPYPT